MPSAVWMIGNDWEWSYSKNGLESYAWVAANNRDWAIRLPPFLFLWTTGTSIARHQYIIWTGKDEYKKYLQKLLRAIVLWITVRFIFHQNIYIYIHILLHCRMIVLRNIPLQENLTNPSMTSMTLWQIMSGFILWLFSYPRLRLWRYYISVLSAVYSRSTLL